jgi:protein involved in sex pheromone biosynthesis
MHFAKDLDGNHRFKIAAFLLARQIQRYFSRKAYKDRRGTEDIHEGDDDQAAQEEDAYLCMY